MSPRQLNKEDNPCPSAGYEVAFVCGYVIIIEPKVYNIKNTYAVDET